MRPRSGERRVSRPVELGILRAISLAEPLSDLESAAVNYIRSFRWSGEVLAMYDGFQEPDILGVFLVHLRPAEPQVDEWLWVVVGDLPPAYLVTDGASNYVQAVAGYVEEMQRWVDAAREGRPIDELIPVNVAPTAEYAEMLQGRLSTLKRMIVDRERDLVQITFRLGQGAGNRVEKLWARPLADGTYEIDSLPFFTCDAAADDIVEAEAIDGELVFIKRVRSSGNNAVRMSIFNLEEAPAISADLSAFGCDVERDGSRLAINVPAGVNYMPVSAYLVRGRQKGRWSFTEGAAAGDKNAPQQ